MTTNEQVAAPLAAELMQLVTSAPMSAGTRNKLQAIALRVAAVEREHTKLAQIGGAALRELYASAAEPSAELPCKLDGACASIAQVRQMCWPCQARWHRKQAGDIERALLADQKPPRIEPRGAEPSEEPAKPVACRMCGTMMPSWYEGCSVCQSALNRTGDA